MTTSAALRIRAGGRRLFVEAAGDGPPVLLLHGGGPGTSSASWRKVVPLLAREGRCVICPDHPGFGRSDALEGAAYGNALFAEALIALLDALCLERVALIGHSMGAQVAMRTALAHPQRVSHLGLVAPGGRSFGLRYRSPGIEAIERFAADPGRAAMRTVVALLAGNAEPLDAAALEEEVSARMAVVERPGILAAQRTLAAGREPGAASGPPLGAALAALDIPILLLWGEHERFNPPELGAQIHAALPAGTRYEVFRGAGHYIPKDQPELVASAIARFLEQ